MQQDVADLRELMHVLMAVDKNRRAPGQVFKAVKLATNQGAQCRHVKTAQPGAGDNLLQAAAYLRILARGKAGEVKVQTQFTAAAVQLGKDFAGQRAKTHQAGRLDAARCGEAADGFIDGRREAEVINIEGDIFHGTAWQKGGRIV